MSEQMPLEKWAVYIEATRRIREQHPDEPLPDSTQVVLDLAARIDALEAAQRCSTGDAPVEQLARAMRDVDVANGESGVGFYSTFAAAVLARLSARGSDSA